MSNKNDKVHETGKNRLVIGFVAIAFLLAMLNLASSDWLDTLLTPEPPSLTLGPILGEAIAIAMTELVYSVPITWLVWNVIVSRTLDVPKINYWKALAIRVALLWMTQP